MAVPTYAIALIVVGALLVVLLTIWLMCEADSRRRRKRNRKVFEETIYNQERARAEDILGTLRTANIARAQAPSTVVTCPHGFYPEGSPSPANVSAPAQTANLPYCPQCYPTGYPVDATCNGRTPHMNMAMSPGHQQPMAVAYQQPVCVGYSGYYPAENGGRCAVPGPAYARGSEMMVVGITPTISSPSVGNYHPSPGGSHIRLAETDEEIPRSPPPIAPPGFVTVPMVVEHT